MCVAQLLGIKANIDEAMPKEFNRWVRQMNLVAKEWEESRRFPVDEYWELHKCPSILEWDVFSVEEFDDCFMVELFAWGENDKYVSVRFEYDKAWANKTPQEIKDYWVQEDLDKYERT